MEDDDDGTFQVGGRTGIEKLIAKEILGQLYVFQDPKNKTSACLDFLDGPTLFGKTRD